MLGNVVDAAFVFQKRFSVQGIIQYRTVIGKVKLFTANKNTINFALFSETIAIM